MRLDDTIAAVATGHAPAERAIIRISGPESARIAERLFETPLPAGRGAHIAKFLVRESPPLPLPCVVLRFVAPRSYTGEDALELVIPAGPAIVPRVLSRLLDLPDVRAAEPGEFSARAFLAGRLSLTQAEGVAAMIAARSAEQWRVARDLLSGAGGDDATRWSEEITDLLALTEAGVDFTDQEDVVPIEPDALAGRIARVLDGVDRTLGASAGASVDQGVPQVVLVGEPNAGKSTLFNALLGRRRAVTSDCAGTTRDALREPLDLSRDVPFAGRVTLVDLPGIGSGQARPAPTDRAAQRLAAEAADEADVIIHCDPAGRFDRPRAPADRVIRVRTKSDLPSPTLEQPAAQALDVCALDGWNLGPLRRAIADAAFSARASDPLAVAPRRRLALVRASRALHNAIEHIDPSQQMLTDPELVADALRSALDALGELSGRVTPDDVIGRVFSTFCVGK